MAATVAKPKREGKPSPPAPLPTSLGEGSQGVVFGNYRCYLDSPDFPGRPCNKRIGVGHGPLQTVCPRCRRLVDFADANDPIR